ncbi:MAG TPA: hypothetical protein VGC66_01230 [Pyrinomonadaceae bacterium]|jgi:hypothetical protein
MKTAIQLILLTWFITVNLFILIPSLFLLKSGGVDESAAIQKPPPPPPPVALAVGPLDSTLDIEKQKQQVEAYKQHVGAYAEQVKAYTQQVTAYGQQVNAYKTEQETRPASRQRAVYELVIKNTLLSLIGSFATTLIAFVFTNLGATVMDNFVRVKNNQPPQPLSLL